MFESFPPLAVVNEAMTRSNPLRPGFRAFEYLLGKRIGLLVCFISGLNMNLGGKQSLYFAALNFDTCLVGVQLQSPENPEGARGLPATRREGSMAVAGASVPCL